MTSDHIWLLGLCIYLTLVLLALGFFCGLKIYSPDDVTLKALQKSRMLLKSALYNGQVTNVWLLEASDTYAEIERILTEEL